MAYSTADDDPFHVRAMDVLRRPPPTQQPRATKRRRKFRFRNPRSTEVEDVRLYRPGGYFAIDVGCLIRWRYRVVHKLGNGGSGIVWLARDQVLRQYVALKILRGDASERELKVLEHLKNTAPGIPIAHLRDSFEIGGMIPRNQCLVIDFVGPSLLQMNRYLRYRTNKPVEFQKSATRKLAEAVASLHAAGVCHGGMYSYCWRCTQAFANTATDLTDNNVLFQIEGIHDWTEEEIYQNLGPLKTEPLLCEDGTPSPPFAPRDVVEPLDYSNFDWSKLSSTPFLADFGEAFFVDKPPEGLGTPLMFTAPELLFGYSPSCAVDLWALGCLVYEITTREWLLPILFHWDPELLFMAIDTIGALPRRWRYLFYDKKFDLEYHPRWFDNRVKRGRWLDTLIKERTPDQSSKEQSALIDLLHKLLVFEPSHRATAAEIAKHPWFADNQHQTSPCTDLVLFRSSRAHDPIKT